VRVRLGSLRHRVTIEAPTKVTLPGGGWRDEHAALAEVWASWEPLEGRERMEAMQAGFAQPVRVAMHYHPGITVRHRLRKDDRTAEIRSVVDPDELHQWLVLLCEEVVR
jgi:SPP1 family predicted phage head-tail adaptor